MVLHTLLGTRLWYIAALCEMIGGLNYPFVKHLLTLLMRTRAVSDRFSNCLQLELAQSIQRHACK